MWVILTAKKNKETYTLNNKPQKIVLTVRFAFFINFLISNLEIGIQEKFLIYIDTQLYNT
jgi:hypothetical protein